MFEAASKVDGEHPVVRTIWLDRRLLRTFAIRPLGERKPTFRMKPVRVRSGAPPLERVLVVVFKLVGFKVSSNWINRLVSRQRLVGLRLHVRRLLVMLSGTGRCS
jgi:hypothetical protein